MLSLNNLSIMDLQGLGVALITPFDARGAIDRAATERLVHFLLEGGTDFFVVLGTKRRPLRLKRGGLMWRR